MHVTEVTLPVPGLDRALTVRRLGHWGRPVLVLPAEAGSARDAEDRGLLDGVLGLADDGKVSLFCVDSLDAWTWSDRSAPTDERARRHRVYHRWLTEVAVPWIHQELGGPQEVVAAGVSLGAYHAVHLALTRADLVPVAIGMSGSYDVTSWNGWGDLGDDTYFANPAAYVPNLHGDHLDWLRARLHLVLVVGQGPFEVSPTQALPSTTSLGRALIDKGIPTDLDVWGFDSAHDWPWWSRQLAHHLPRFL